MVPADWTNFVAQFDLGRYGGTFAQFQPQLPGVVNCIAPPVATPANDFFETVLDAEWATAIAPGAHVEVASCSTSDGLYVGGANLINAATRPNIISVSYGYGESEVDSQVKTAFDLLWAQADAEGISMFVATGDGGTSLDNHPYPILTVNPDANALATSPNDTAVGGTDTADILEGTTSTYFSKTLNSVYGSALSYVPEIPWNTSCGNPVAATANGYASAVAFCKADLADDPYGYYLTSEASSGAPSTVDAKPAWQRQVWGAAKDQWRDLPDVALFGGSYGGYTWVIICEAAYPCTPGASSNDT